MVRYEDELKNELIDFDVFPMVFLKGEETEITVKQLGIHKGFNGFIKGETYYIDLLEVNKAEERRFPGTNGFQNFAVTATENAFIKFKAVCPREGKYLIHLYLTPEKKNRIAEFEIYALDEDMKGKLPFRGDLHMHTCMSDGYHAPEIVASHYRENGYDFTVISDHNRYYPSLLAREALKIKDDKSEITDFLVVPGEEVHIIGNDIHTVNFGGKFSVNALIRFGHPYLDSEDPKERSLNGDCPDILTEDDYNRIIEEYSKDVPLEIDSERKSYAIEKWICEMIKKAEGLSIYAHPYWHCRTMQISKDYSDFVYKQGDFDAFEVLGGESYYNQNGFQTAYYYEMKQNGFDRPIVGTTDSHNSTHHNRNGFVASTIVFAEENSTKAIINAVLNKYSVAVDTISPEYRLVGDFRLISYASFLMENWYPLHDKVTKADGYYLKRFVTGDANAEPVLKTLKGQIPSLMKKYFKL